MGAASMRLKDYSRATRMFAKAAGLAPEQESHRTQLALSQLVSGNVTHAVSDLNRFMMVDTAGPGTGIMLGMIHLKQGKFDKALVVAEKMIERDPMIPVSYNLAGAAEFGLGDAAAARARFERALEIDPTFEQAILNLAQIDAHEEEFDSAIDRYNEVLEIDSGDIDAFIGLAKAHELKGEIEIAIDFLEQIKFHDELRSQILLLSLYTRNQRHNDALTLAQKLKVLYPTNPSVWDKSGHAEIAAGEPDYAATSFRRVAALTPDSANELVRVARLQYAVDDMVGARETLKTAIEVDPMFAPAHLRLAEIEATTGNIEEALKIAYRLQLAIPDSAAPDQLIGDLLMLDEQISMAAQAYNHAFMKESTAPLLEKLYRAYRAAGSARNAIPLLEIWIRNYPDDQAISRLLATAYGDVGRIEEAIKRHESLLESLPDDIATVNNLALLYQRIGDSRAVAFAKRAHELAPEHPATLDTLGWILVESGDVANGMAYLRKAIDRAPNLDVAHFHLAVALNELGDVDAAREELRKALESSNFFDERAEAESFLKRLSSE